MSETKQKVAIIIPCSAKSRRLPRKPLLDETGKPLALHTYEAALQSKMADEVWIAADEECFGAIQKWCHVPGRFCYVPKMRQIDGDYRNGTQRVAAAAKSLGGFDVVVNLQCDEPLVTGEMLDKLIGFMQTPIPALIDQSDDIRFHWAATLIAPLSRGAGEDASIVKAAVELPNEGEINQRPFLAYFSRANLAGAMQHIGVYAFESKMLDLRISKMSETNLSRAEGLEQLAWLGDLQPISIDHAPLSINTRADYDRFVELMRQPV